LEERPVPADCQNQQPAQQNLLEPSSHWWKSFPDVGGLSMRAERGWGACLEPAGQHLGRDRGSSRAVRSFLFRSGASA
jgi:hypothetical protein